MHTISHTLVVFLFCFFFIWDSRSVLLQFVFKQIIQNQVNACTFPYCYNKIVTVCSSDITLQNHTIWLSIFIKSEKKKQTLMLITKTRYALTCLLSILGKQQVVNSPKIFFFLQWFNVISQSAFSKTKSYYLLCFVDFT